MSAQHTPGPWAVSRNNAGAIPLHFQPLEVIGRGGACCVAAKLGDGPEALANAHLIAAAPELLAACQALLAEAELHGLTDNDAHLREARAAIAKAKGGAK